jgi:hypothetical protein
MKLLEIKDRYPKGSAQGKMWGQLGSLQDKPAGILPKEVPNQTKNVNLIVPKDTTNVIINGTAVKKMAYNRAALRKHPELKQEFEAASDEARSLDWSVPKLVSQFASFATYTDSKLTQLRNTIDHEEAFLSLQSKKKLLRGGDDVRRLKLLAKQQDKIQLFTNESYSCFYFLRDWTDAQKEIDRAIHYMALHTLVQLLQTYQSGTLRHRINERIEHTQKLIQQYPDIFELVK